MRSQNFYLASARAIWIFASNQPYFCWNLQSVLIFPTENFHAPPAVDFLKSRFMTPWPGRTESLVQATSNFCPLDRLKLPRFFSIKFHRLRFKSRSTNSSLDKFCYEFQFKISNEKLLCEIYHLKIKYVCYVRSLKRSMSGKYLARKHAKSRWCNNLVKLSFLMTICHPSEYDRIEILIIFLYNQI